jgi:hypothetical protein
VRIVRDATRKRESGDRCMVLSPNAVLPLVSATPRTASTAKLLETMSSGIQTGTSPATAK